MYKICAIFNVFVLRLFISTTALGREVSVLGDCVGVKVYTDGLIVTNTSTVCDINGKTVNIAAGYDIKKGDIIKRVNGQAATSTKTVTDALKDTDRIKLTIARNEKLRDVTVTAAKTKNGAKLGLWLRDSTAGMGTITCYDENGFAALGHGICDIDTGNIMPVRYGIIQKCSDYNITKGKSGAPGAITGNIDGAELGIVKANTDCGLFGTAGKLAGGKKMTVAQIEEIRTGDAAILANVDGEGVKEYKAEIKRVALPSKNGKDMIIEITDEALLSKTGGIVQGMSGSPILQNGKIVGAVTHVFVNDPTRGYGIFIENMLSEAEKIKQ